MFLFYSDTCSHCTMLIESLKSLDKQKQIKLISIDYLKSNNIVFDPRITHVPAMLLANSKILFGKEVFDHLLLPGKGILLKANNSTVATTNNNVNNPTEPEGLDSYISQSYENLNENDTYLTGPVKIWESFDSTESKTSITTNTKPIGNNDTEKSHKQLPSLAEIQQMRESALH